MLKLMKTMFAALLVGFLLQAVQFTASAIPITGELNMGGAAVLNNSSLSSATGVTSFLGVRANSASTGVFTDAGSDRALITMNKFNWNPSSAPVLPLWSFDHDGVSFWFNLDSLLVVSHTANFLNLTGVGTIFSSAYDSVKGSWSFTISDPDGTGTGSGNFRFGFQSASTAVSSVPDGGTSAVLLGLSFLGFAVLRRK